MRAAALLPILLLFATGASAQNSVPAEQRILPWTGVIPACEEPAVLSKIQGRFAHREDKFWNSGLRIVGYEHVRPVAYRPWGTEMIPRRYCSGVAYVAETPEIVRKRAINYVIQEDLGPIGMTWNVAWCVVGIDRHMANAPNCRMDRP